jgi:hypothetical protein
MREIKNTAEAIDAIMLAYNVGPGEDHVPRAIYWAPGDCTRYTVALLKMRPFEYLHGYRMPNITMLFVSSAGLSLVIPKPQTEYTFYSVEHFFTKFGERYMGWWGAVRPLLAGLGWTPSDERNTEFAVSDAARIGDLLRRH